MPLAILFWVILIVAFLFGAWSHRSADGKFDFTGFSGSLVLWVLLAILGWAVFGGPVK